MAGSAECEPPSPTTSFTHFLMKTFLSINGDRIISNTQTYHLIPRPFFKYTQGDHLLALL